MIKFIVWFCEIPLNISFSPFADGASSSFPRGLRSARWRRSSEKLRRMEQGPARSAEAKYAADMNARVELGALLGST